MGPRPSSTPGRVPPPYDYRDTPDSFYEESARLIEQYHGRSRLLYSIAPRFAFGSTPDQLTRAGQLKEEYPGCWVQTHLSANPAEVEAVLRLFPEARDDLEAYG